MGTDPRRATCMTRLYTGLTAGSIYRHQLVDLMESPEHIVEVRGRPTREALNVVTEIYEPRTRCQVVPGRKFNPWLALSEALWLLAGRNDVASLIQYNKRITEFSDDGVTLYGAYGYRLMPQIEDLIQRLKEDSNDRRAVLQIWNASDLTAATKDPPCNTQLMFKLRNGRLNMLVTNRSNDIHWGLYAVNVFQFGILQEYLAYRLGVELGTQTHISNSLHVYTDKRGQDITDRMYAAMGEPLEYFEGSRLFEGVDPDIRIDLACGAVLDGQYGMSIPPIPFLEFAEDFLRLRRDNMNPDHPIRHHREFEDWVRMGVEFVR